MSVSLGKKTTSRYYSIMHYHVVNNSNTTLWMKNTPYCIILVQYVCFLGVGKINHCWSEQETAAGFFQDFPVFVAHSCLPTAEGFCLNFIYPCNSEKAKKMRKKWKVWTHSLTCTSTDQRDVVMRRKWTWLWHVQMNSESNAVLRLTDNSDCFIRLCSLFENHTWLRAYLFIYQFYASLSFL